METINLYLKIKSEKGVFFKLRDPRSHRFIPGFEVCLFPHKPTAVEAKKARGLLLQDPHLVSKEPYSVENDPQEKIRQGAKDRLDTFGDEPENIEERKAANERFRYQDEYGEDFTKPSPKEEKEETKKDVKIDTNIVDYAPIMQKIGDMPPEEFESLKLEEYKGLIRSLGGTPSVRSKRDARNLLLELIDQRTDQLDSYLSNKNND